MTATVARRKKPRPAAKPTPAPPRLALPERYTARQIVLAAAWFRQHPDGVGVVDTYGGRTFTAGQWWAWFRQKLAEKITAADPRRPTGRKAGGEYQTELYRLRAYVGARLVCRWVAPVLGKRVRAAMADRLANND